MLFIFSILRPKNSQNQRTFSKKTRKDTLFLCDMQEKQTEFHIFRYFLAIYAAFSV